MKSLLISSIYFPPQRGGISHFMRGVASALGPDRVCCLTGVAARDGNGRDDFERSVYRRPAMFGGTKCGQAIAWGASITQIMVGEYPRAVQLATVSEGYMGLWLRRWLKLPFVVYAHGNEILGAMEADWQKPRLALQQADRVLANSQFTAKLVQRAGVAPDRIAIVRPGCEVDRFQPREPRMDLRQKLLGPRYRDQVILTIGTLVPRKGQDMVIRSLPRLLQRIPEVTYLIIGDGPFRGQLEALAAATGVRERVVLAGRVPDEELADIYALSDVFVMPSRADLDACDVEGFGLVFLEANACGKPVVGGRSGGIPEAVVDGVTGVLVDPHNPEDIADALARLLTDSDLAAWLGRQGRLRVVREFAWARVAAEVQEILTSVVRGESRRRNSTDVPPAETYPSSARFN